MRDGGWSTLRDAENGIALQFHRTDHGIQIQLERFERQIDDITVRETVATTVIPDEIVAGREEAKQRPADRIVPLVFEMIEPGRGTNERRSLPDAGDRKIETIRRAAERDLLSA